MKLACCTIHYSRYGLRNAINEIADIGYEGVEIWTGRPHLFRGDLDSELPQIQELLRQNRLEVVNLLPAQLACPVFLASTNEIVRSDSVLHMQYVIDNAVKVGAPSINLCSGPTRLDENIEDNMVQLKRSIGEILLYAEKKRVNVLIEAGQRFETDLIRTARQAIQTIDEFSSERLGLLLDSGHMILNKESVSDAFDAIPTDTPLHLHVNDNDGMSDAHGVPGTGKVDVLSFLKAAKQHGYDGYVSVEMLMRDGEHPYVMAKEAYDNCKQLIAAL